MARPTALRPRSSAGATALCVATVGEALALRRPLPDARLLVLGPAAVDEVAAAREARLELTVSGGEIPDNVAVHVKLDTGMGRWGVSELPAPSRSVVGVMTHLATADSDLEFARTQIERFREATEPLAAAHAPRREQRRRPAAARVEVRRGALRDRALRAVAVRDRRCRRRPRSRAALDERDRPVAGSCARASRRLRPPVRRRARHVDRDRAGRVRRRLPARSHRHRGARRGRAAVGWWGRCRWTRSPSSSSASCRRHARDDRRRRPLARGARTRRRHDHLRARLADRLVARARDASGGRR